jgi:hypothetical protein
MQKTEFFELFEHCTLVLSASCCSLQLTALFKLIQFAPGKLLIDRSKHKKMSVENIINCPFKTQKAEM